MAHAAYGSDWPDADVRTQKLMVIVVGRSQVPQYLKGLDFFIVSFPALAKVQ